MMGKETLTEMYLAEEARRDAEQAELQQQPSPKLCYHCTQATKKAPTWQDKLIDAITEAVREALSSA